MFGGTSISEREVQISQKQRKEKTFEEDFLLTRRIELSASKIQVLSGAGLAMSLAGSHPGLERRFEPQSWLLHF